MYRIIRTMAVVMFRSFITESIFSSSKCKLCARRLFSKIGLKRSGSKRLFHKQHQLNDLIPPHSGSTRIARHTHTSVCSLKCDTPEQHKHQQDNHPVNPESLVQSELSSLCSNIQMQLQSACSELQAMAQYHFDGGGKAMRPMLILLTAKACNYHSFSNGLISDGQRTVAQIAEMIHVASLVHDDVIDASDTRRGKPTVQRHWGQKKAIMTGDFILSRSSQMLAQLRHTEVVTVLSQVLEDLVRGEFMQLGSKENESERFNHYLRKTFKKTASLIANSCKAVAILGECSDSVVELAYQYGKNTGIAFQLVDDLLDFTSSDHVMGKPTAADLRLGLATAPVLFAAQEHPELDALIMRRFSEEGDVEHTRHLVAKSDGVAHTRFLAERHSQEAMRLLRELKPSTYTDALTNITRTMLFRSK